MLDNDLTKKQQIPQFQAMSQAQAAGITNQNQQSMQANPELLKQNIQDSYVGGRVAETADDPKGMLATGAIAVPTWFAISQGMDYYNKKCRGDFNDTVLHKIGKFGDDIANFTTQNKFAKSSFGQSIASGYNSVKKFIKNNIVGKSKILQAFAYTPSRPELGIVLDQYMSMSGILMQDYGQPGEKFTDALKHVEDLDCYGATPDEIKKFKNAISNATTKEARAEILQNAEVETILKNSRKNLTPAQIAQKIADFKALTPEAKLAKLKDMKAFEWGFKDFATYEKIVKEHHKYLPEILEATNNANKNMLARIWGSNSSMAGKIKKFLFGREVHTTEFANKFAASLGNYDPAENPELHKVVKKLGLDKKLPKTAFGKGLLKYSNMILEGATNRVAGGKLVAIMQAGYLADVIYKTVKTEGGGGEKFKSFMERFTEMISFFVCMPFALKLMHHIGGLQYIGMDKQKLDAYRKALKLHNETAMAGGFKDKAAWKASRNNLKTLRNAGIKNPFTKLLKSIGRTVTVGLEQIRPYDKKAVVRNGVFDKIKDLFRHPKFGMKQMAGYPMRIILGMMILLPMFNKIAVKGSHLLFGKPKKSILDEGKEEEAAKKQAEALQAQQLQQMQQAQQQAQQQTTTQTSQNTRTISGQQSPSNLLNRYKNQPQNGAQNTTTTATTTNTVNNTPANKPTEPVRTYIPSPQGVVVNNQTDTSAADAAMMRANNAEKIALQTLKMN